jgi:hypothetical protein
VTPLVTALVANGSAKIYSLVLRNQEADSLVHLFFGIYHGSTSFPQTTFPQSTFPQNCKSDISLNDGSPNNFSPKGFFPKRLFPNQLFPKIAKATFP